MYPSPRRIYPAFILAFLAASLSLTAQVTVVSGKVTVARDGEPVPFANIYFKGTTIGVTSAEDGSYRLETQTPGDSLSASFMGYYTRSFAVQPGRQQVINFILEESSHRLGEVVVLPEEDIAEILMRWVFRQKDINDPGKIPYYQCEIYSKLQIDLNNLGEKFRKRRVLRPFEVVFEYLDTSSLNQKVYLPVFLSESVSDLYCRKSPGVTREIIRANRISGVNNESITQYLGGIMEPVNIYDNYLKLFEKNFVSPIAGFGLASYRYHIDDTLTFEGHNCFKISFEPRRKQELTFTGTLWIADTTYAVKKVEMRVAEDANFNFINDYLISQTYRYEQGRWVLTRDFRLIDLNPLENTGKGPGTFIHRTSSYRDFNFEEPVDEASGAAPMNIVVADNARNKDEEFWKFARHDSLSPEEQGIYDMVDSVKSVPVFKTWEDIVYLVTSGYLMAGNFEIGPLYKSVSFNSIEGLRLRVGGRTSNAFSRKVMLEGHLAYGFRDATYKYGLGITYMLSTNPRRSFGISHSYDMEQLGQSQAAFSEDNFFATFFRRSPADKLNMVREYSGFYEHEWFQGFSNTLSFIHRDLYAFRDTGFTILEGGNQHSLPSLTTSEIQVTTRFAFRERYLYGSFERVSLGTRYPVAEIIYTYSIPDFLDGSYEYHRLQFRLKQRFNLGGAGWSRYIFEAGKVWGKVPYPLLKLHEGNETVLFYESAGNLVNYYEFISDYYASLYYTHHFDGFFLNRIPLLRKLKWREVVHGRAIWGNLTPMNAKYSVLPDISGPVDKPYFEAGVGIENIFRIGRIDAVWRLSHLDSPGAVPFRIFFSFQFSF